MLIASLKNTVVCKVDLYALFNVPCVSYDQYNKITETQIMKH